MTITWATRIALAVVALLATAGLAGCAPGPEATPRATPRAGATTQAAASDAVVMVIRHGEKPDGTLPGLDAKGQEDDSSLTRIGWNRAYGLINLFDPAQGPLRPGLARPKAIYAAGANDDGDGTRTRETVKPLADELGIPVNTSFGKGEEEALVEHVIAQPGPTLISWQHGEIPAIAAAFPSVTPTPPSDWPDDRFDVVWIFTKTADGWRFSQMPERVLPQDQAEIIEN